jgi:hypothetical protein
MTVIVFMIVLSVIGPQQEAIYTLGLGLKLSISLAFTMLEKFGLIMASLGKYLSLISFLNRL